MAMERAAVRADLACRALMPLRPELRGVSGHSLLATRQDAMPIWGNRGCGGSGGASTASSSSSRLRREPQMRRAEESEQHGRAAGHERGGRGRHHFDATVHAGLGALRLQRNQSRASRCGRHASSTPSRPSTRRRCSLHASIPLGRLRRQPDWACTHAASHTLPGRAPRAGGDGDTPGCNQSHPRR